MRTSQVDRHPSGSPRPAAGRGRARIIAILAAVLVPTLSACGGGRGRGDSVSADERRAIADSLSALVTQAYDFSKAGAPARLLSLYPDTGRVISAVAGRVTTRRDTLEGEIRGFWQRVGQNMREPKFVLGSTYVDIITRDAAVMTLTYRIPHVTPGGMRHLLSGAWTMLWRRDDGAWKIVQEHLSDTPESTDTATIPAGPTDSPQGGATARHQHH